MRGDMDETNPTSTVLAALLNARKLQLTLEWVYQEEEEG